MSLKREMSTTGILFASVSAIIGSGWLFGSLYAAQMAGPAAILSWIIGGVAIIFIAFCFAELACLYPVAGGIGVFPLYSHGKTVSFIISWISWLAFIVISPIEVQAVVQYSANYLPSLVVKINNDQHLSAQGLSVAILLLLSLTAINSMSVKLMSRANSLLTIWKIAIPILVIILFFTKKFEIQNLTHFGGFAPQGAHGIFSSLAVGGIILAFNGFQPGVALAGETKNPQKNIPIAIIGSLVICTIIYCLLQVSFLTAIPSHFLENGWKNLTFTQDAGPLAGLAVVLGLAWLAKLLYIDALVSPMGAAGVFFAAAARTSFSMSKSLFLPKFFQQTTKSGVPIFGVIFNFLISVFIFLTFSGWQEMAAFYAAAICLGNSFIPLVLVAIRKQKNSASSSFQIPSYKLFSFIAFYISNLMLYWCGWDMVFRLDVAIFIGLALISIDSMIQKRVLFPDLRTSLSLFLLIILMSIASKLGSYGNGMGIINLKWEFFVIFALSVFLFWVSSKSSLLECEQTRNWSIK